MLGWMIIIAQQTPEQRDQSDQVMPRDQTAELARWEASVHGIQWLQKLTQEGKAQQIKSHGYPNRFVSTAREVLPLIANGPPKHSGVQVIGDDYVMPGDWTGKVVLHQTKIKDCPPDAVLTIDAWDLS